MHLRARGKPRNLADVVVGRITTVAVADDRRSEHVLLVGPHSLEGDLEGYGAVLSLDSGDATHVHQGIVDVHSLDYLETGDVVALHPSGMVEVLFRRASPHNTLLTTERCNSLCIMCSQPPKDIDDSWRATNILRALDLMDPSCQELGLTG